MKTKDPRTISKVGEVVVILSNDQNKGKWTLGIMTDVLPGLDNTVRAVRLKTSKSYLEGEVQYLYLLELTCDVDRNSDCRTNENLNTDNN